MQYDLPIVVQEPDCGQTFDQFAIESISSSLSEEQVNSVISLDSGLAKIIIQTDDEAFIGQSVKLFVIIDEDFVHQEVILQKL